MASILDDVRQMARGWRWTHRPLTPRSAEPWVGDPEPREFPTGWARTPAAKATREAVLRYVFRPIVWSESQPTVEGLDNLEHLEPPVLFVANHASHMDTPLLLCSLPRSWREKTAVAAAAGHHHRAEADRRGLEPRGVPGGNTVQGRLARPVAARGGPPGRRVRGAGGPGGPSGNVRHDAQGTVLAGEGPAPRVGPVRRTRSSRARRGVPHAVPAHAAGTGPAGRRGRLDLVGVASTGGGGSNPGPDRTRRPAVATRVGSQPAPAAAIAPSVAPMKR